MSLIVHHMALTELTDFEFQLILHGNLIDRSIVRYQKAFEIGIFQRAGVDCLY